jgi:SAM-dependent methyltransferase
VNELLTQQVREPDQERQLRSSMPRLTAIGSGVSQAVRQQYEDNPYPRWVKTAIAGKPKTIDAHAHENFPLAPLRKLGKADRLDVLVAGCGTGQHSIETALKFQGANVLAVDLSLASLSYAKNKTRSLGLENIEYAQADILNLGSIGRTFDLVEASGVLHHLADPLAGWRVLVSLLRPAGFMGLGFYSEIARRHVVAARKFIAGRGYGATADDIRKCRQDIVDLDDSAGIKAVMGLSDFFSLSECRDLLFHVQEHRLTLPEIDRFLAENNLQFLGFRIRPNVLQKYSDRFPDDKTRTDLSLWHRFEQENPDTFINMYQFWVQKRADG